MSDDIELPVIEGTSPARIEDLPAMVAHLAKLVFDLENAVRELQTLAHLRELT